VTKYITRNTRKHGISRHVVKVRNFWFGVKNPKK